MKGLNMTQGCCIFCGQIIAVEVPEGCKNEIVDGLATEECQCDEAKRYKIKKKGKREPIKPSKNNLEIIQDIR